MTDFGRRPGNMLKSVYDPDLDGVIAIAQTEADMKTSVYDDDHDGVVKDSDKLQASNKAQVQDHTPKSHTHTESQISNLDHDALKVKGVIINDAAIGDQKVLAYDLATERIVYIEQAPSGATIDHIEQVSITFAADEATKDATIAEVNMDLAILIFGGHEGAANADWGAFTVELIDSTTVRATRGTALTTPTVKCTVLEFSSGIASVQRGITTLTSVTSIDVDITAIVLAKSFVSCLGWNYTSGAWERCCCNVTLKDADTITIARASSTGIAKCSWEVVEFS